MARHDTCEQMNDYSTSREKMGACVPAVCDHVISLWEQKKRCVRLPRAWEYDSIYLYKRNPYLGNSEVSLLRHATMPRQARSAPPGLLQRYDSRRFVVRARGCNLFPRLIVWVQRFTAERTRARLYLASTHKSIHTTKGFWQSEITASPSPRFAISPLYTKLYILRTTKGFRQSRTTASPSPRLRFGSKG